MKIKHILIGFAILSIFAALFAGCAKPPLEEMENAKEAVFRAENDADAVAFGATHISRARDALRRMQVEADSKRYESAKTYAAEAVMAAERAITEGKSAASRVRNEAELLLTGLAAEIEETARNLNGARYANMNLDYEQLNSDLSSARNDADTAERERANGRYQAALDNGKKARSTLGSINEKISAATVRSKS